MTGEVLGSYPEFILAKIGERFSMRRTPHGTEVWWYVLQPVPHLPVTSLSQSVSPRRSRNWQSDVLGFVVTESSLGKFISFFVSQIALVSGYPP